MDCQGKKGAQKQKEALQEITETVKARKLDEGKYNEAAKILKEYLGRPLTKTESDILRVTGGLEDAVQIRREDLDAVGQYIDHVWLNTGDKGRGAVHIVRDHLGNDLTLHEMLYLGEVIKKGKASLSESKQGKINHKYEMVIDGNLYFAIIVTGKQIGRAHV